MILARVSNRRGVLVQPSVERFTQYRFGFSIGNPGSSHHIAEAVRPRPRRKTCPRDHARRARWRRQQGSPPQAGVWPGCSLSAPLPRRVTPRADVVASGESLVRPGDARHAPATVPGCGALASLWVCQPALRSKPMRANTRRHPWPARRPQRRLPLRAQSRRARRSSRRCACHSREHRAWPSRVR